MISAWNDYYGYATPTTHGGHWAWSSVFENGGPARRNQVGARVETRFMERPEIGRPARPGSRLGGRHVEEVFLGPAARRGLVRSGGVARVPGGEPGVAR